MTRPLSDLIDEAVERAPQLLFDAAAAEGTVEQLPELLAALQGPAVRDTLAMRIEQIARHGHSAARDDLLPLDDLPRIGCEFGKQARELIVPGERRNLAAARRKLVRMTAAGLAAIDRLDRQIIKEASNG